MNLPELPSPHNIINGVWYYTAEQVREAVRMEREACAKLCDEQAEAHSDREFNNTQAAIGCDGCADAIRSRD